MSYQLSYSSISTFLECPKCFYLDRKLKIKRPEGIKSGIPARVDKIIKESFDGFGGKLPTKLLGYPELAGFVLYDGADLKKMQHWKSNPLKLTDKNGNTVVGAFDGLLYNPTTKQYAYLDFKSTGKEPDQEFGEKYYQKQCDIYSAFLVDGGRSIADFGVLVFFYPVPSDKGFIKFESKVIFLKPNVDNARDLFRRSALCLESELTPPSGNDCEYCAYAFERGAK